MPLPLSRRQFIASSTALLSASYFPWAWARTHSPKLPIPALVDGTSGVPVDLEIRTGQWQFKTGVTTPTLGFSQNYLGPTIRTRQNSELTLHYKNTLDEPVAVHGHGLHVPGDVDGGPQLAMAPGESWQPTLSIVQRAATCWYHSHTHGSTGRQVYSGLAGMMIIDDEHSDSLPLPKQYGIDDLPVIIQDRTFDAQGNLVYSLNDAGEDGWLGETVVINGAITPVTHVPAGKIRLRILNGSNARFYVVGFVDKRTFHKIATDGGLLPAPVALTTTEMGPGERCEIIVDMADGNPAELLTLFEDEVDEDGEGLINSLLSIFSKSDKTTAKPSLTLLVDQKLTANTEPLPEQLSTISRPKESEIKNTRDFILEMDGAENNGGGHGHHGLMDMTINKAAMDMDTINEQVKLGEWERWRIRSDQGEHPFHIHGCSFLIAKIGGEAVPLAQQGWKDTVAVDDDGWSEVIVRFDFPATSKHPYMYHCHILEHEDRGMMGQFTVS
ncbi:hypothetical protein AB833_32095 [Chromatiales bacterium (ex Bugula neritina AB1)]|nr:hypothetical protein AB833_32095 [Chromatiales bacterium (ex Bugula neritina AB1)]